MSVTILAPSTLTPVGPETNAPTIHTASLPFYLDTVVQAIAVNGNASPNRPCVIRMQLSIDNVNFVDVDSRQMQMGAGVTDYQVFRLGDYAGSSGNFGSGDAAPLPWTSYRLSFGGNAGVTGSAITVSATADSGFFAAAIFSQVTNVTVTATGNSTLLSTTGAYGSLVIPASFWQSVGQTLSIRAWGYETTGGTPGNQFVYVQLGTNTIATSGTYALTASKTTVGYLIDVVITCKAIGASGLLDCGGQWNAAAIVGSNVPIGNGTTPGTVAPTVQVPINLTQAYTLNLLTNFSATGNTIVQTNCNVEALP